jgi:hypothetical protein
MDTFSGACVFYNMGYAVLGLALLTLLIIII